MAKHVCPNRYIGEGAQGGCFVEIEPSDREGVAVLRAGWSCVIVHDGQIPVTWLSELIAIATGHPGGIKAFLAEHNYGGGYALTCDPASDYAHAVPEDCDVKIVKVVRAD
jgi:hypothetical protein